MGERAFANFGGKPVEIKWGGRIFPFDILCVVGDLDGK